MPKHEKALTAPSAREYIAYGPKYLVGLIKGRTEDERLSLVRLYVGKWMKLSGKIQLVSPEGYPGKGTNVMVAPPYIDLRRDYITAFCMVRGSQTVTAKTLQKESEISIQGKISDVSELGVGLDPCEITQFESGR